MYRSMYALLAAMRVDDDTFTLIPRIFTPNDEEGGPIAKGLANRETSPEEMLLFGGAKER